MDNLNELLDILEKYTTGELQRGIDLSTEEVYYNDYGYRCVIGEYLHSRSFHAPTGYTRSVLHLTEDYPEYKPYFDGIPTNLLHSIQLCHDSFTKKSFVRLADMLMLYKGKDLPSWLQDLCVDDTPLKNIISKENNIP